MTQGDQARILVLGTGYANSRTTVQLIEAVAKERGVEVTLEEVEAVQDIMQYGVVRTPAVVVEGKVVDAGGATMGHLTGSRGMRNGAIAESDCTRGSTWR